MSKLSIFLIVLFCSAFSAVSGGLAGYYAALAVPTVSSVAVIDLEQIAAGVDVSSPDARRNVELLTAKAREVTERLTSAGMVVLDRNAVVAAPPESIVRIDIGSTGVLPSAPKK